MRTKNNLSRQNKKQRIRRTLKYGVLVVFILCILVLCVEALLPGSVSGQHSSDMGELVDVPVDQVIEPTDLKLSALDQELRREVYVGESITLLPIFTPKNATYMQVVYALSNKELATLQDDTITFVGAGEVKVTAISEYNTDLYDSFDFNVVEMPVQSISITAPEKIFVGRSKYLEVEIMPQNATNKEYTLHSSDPDCISVEGKTITAKKEGSAYITAISAYDRAVQSVVKVTATAIKVTSLQFKLGGEVVSEIGLTQGQIASLSVELMPQNATNKELTFAVSDGLNVDFWTPGAITIQAADVGEYTIKVTAASDPAIFALLKVTVSSVKAESIKYAVFVQGEPSEDLTAYVGDDIRIRAEILPKFATDEVRFSATNGLEIDSEGKVSASKAGEYTVTISCDDVEATFVLEIHDVKVTGVELLLRGETLKGGLELAINEKLALSYRLITLPSDRAPQDARAVYEIDGDCATVTNGVLRGISEGKATVTVTHEASGQFATATVTVTGEREKEIIDLWLTIGDERHDGSGEGPIGLKTGKRYPLRFYAETSDGPTSEGISYAVTGECVELAGGELTAKFSGDGVITLALGGRSEEFAFEVTDVKTERIELEQAMTVAYRETFSLSPTLIGENGDAPTDELRYEFDRTKLSKNGSSTQAYFTALKVGVTHITVFAGEASCEVTIEVVSNIKAIEAQSQTFYVGEQYAIDFVPVTSGELPAPTKYSFTVERGGEFVTIDAMGIIKARKECEVLVKISAAGVETEVELKAVDRLIDSIQLTPPKDAKVGQSYKLGVTYEPESATAKRILYTVSDPTKARITADGVLKFQKAGLVTVYAAAERGESRSSVTFLIRNVLHLTDAEAINFDSFDGFDALGNASGSLTKNSSARLSFLFGDDATYRKVTLISSSPDVIYIDGNVLTAKKVGSATVTVVYHDGSDQKKQIYTIQIEVRGQKLSDIATNWGYKIRKSLGHYGAFMFMGIFAILTFVLFIKNRYLASILTFASGFGIAGLTELLQMIAPNRGPSFADVLLDFQGFCTSTVPILIGFCIVWAVKYFKAKRSSKESNEN